MDPQPSTLNLQRSGRPGVIARYARYLPVCDATPVVTLNEGDTPLIRAVNLVAAIGGGVGVWVEKEGLDPTRPFKDPGLTRGVFQAKGKAAQGAVLPRTG